MNLLSLVHHCGRFIAVYLFLRAEDFCNAIFSGEKSEELLAMYKKELDHKKKLIDNIAHADNIDSMTFFTCAWKYQPYLDAGVIIAALITETRPEYQ